METMQRYFLGREGFVWFLGVVEDRNDPEQMGRVRVRCFGWHTDDKALIPTEDLPWAHSVTPMNSPATGVPKEGEWVIGFFQDGASAQHPMILSVIHGKPTQKPNASKGFADPSGVQPKRVNEPTTSRLARAREDGTVIETRRRNLKTGVKGIGSTTWNEPEPAFSPQYPFNWAHETESGHAFELDDTEGSERIHLAHKNGSFIELAPDGTRVEKIVKDKYTLTLGDDYVYVEGTCNITVMGDTNLKVGGTLNVEAKAINMAANKDIRIKAGGKLKMESGATTDIKASGAAKIGSGGKLSLKGKSTAIQGKSLTLGGSISNKVKTKHGIGKILPTGTAASPSNTGLKDPS